MTIEELKAQAEGALDFGLEHLRETGQLAMMFHLVLRSGGIEVVLVTADVTNDEDAKRKLARLIRERVAAGEIVAVIMLSDTFFAEGMTKEANALRIALGLTIEQAADAGLWPKREAIIVRLESPIYWLHMQQEYTRDPDDCRKIAPKGERIQTDSLDGGPNQKSRFTSFWPETAAHGAAKPA